MSLTRPQSARAWVNFNGTGTVAIRDSFNVSSITDNGTGDYTVNFDQAMPNANYNAVGSIWNTADGGSSEIASATRGVPNWTVEGTSVPSTTALNIKVRTPASATGNGADADYSGVYVTIFGDAS